LDPDDLLARALGTPEEKRETAGDGDGVAIYGTVALHLHAAVERHGYDADAIGYPWSVPMSLPEIRDPLLPQTW
jgi:hypothetical protein